MAASLAFAQNPSVGVDEKAIVKQTPDLPYTCTFATILNCLAFGDDSLQSIYRRIPGRGSDEKLSFLVKKYGSEPSVVNSDRKAYDQAMGVHNEDVVATLKALLDDAKLPTVQGFYADRIKEETSAAYLRRIHRQLSQSLVTKVPVMATIETYAAFDYEDIPTLKWRGGYSHTILITSVPKSLTPYEKGFAFQFVDSLHGTIEEGYVYAEDAREFQAGKRNGANFEWMNGSPYLLVILPSLSLGTEREASGVRTIMTLTYLIGRWSG